MTGRRPTLSDVAARAGVSRALASLVIRDAPGPSEASRAAVRAAAAELGYRPDVAAQLLRSRRSRLVGVLFSARDPFHADLLEAVHAVTERLGYDVVLSAAVPSRSETRAVESLLASRCEALVLLGSQLTGPRLAALVGDLPVVLVSRRIPAAAPAQLDVVRTDDVTGTALAVDHLVSLGHREVVFVDGGRHAEATDRRRGYREAMRRHGLADRIRVLAGDWTEESGARAAGDLLADGLPGSGVTAVLASNDRCAVGVLDTLRAAGVDVPGEVSVVGYDDSAVSRLARVDLTTVRQDADELARLAVEAAVGRAAAEPGAERPAPRDAVLSPKLVVRSTTGPVRAPGPAVR